MASGPLLGGALVAGDGWRSVFWVNVPIGLAALVLTACCLPESRTATPRRADPLGQALVVVLLGGLTFAVIRAPRLGWGAPAVWGCLTAAVLALFCLVPCERRRRDPLVDPRFFRSIPFSGSVAVSLVSFAALGGVLFVSTLYLQDVRGLSALPAGMWMLPMPVMTMLLAPLAGRLTGGGRGARLPLVLAGSAMALSGLMCAAFQTEGSAVLLLVAYGLFGAGIGLVDVPATALAVSGMPRSRAGVASGITMATCRVGVALGVAVLGAVLSSGLHGPAAAAGAAGFTTAAHPVRCIVTGCGAAVALAGVLVTSGRAERSARETAARLAPADGTAAGPAVPGPSARPCGRTAGTVAPWP
ncbi:MFS transporter [Streptomyces sp. NPDC001404]|uniref:MFS transporter n=1 Tax=Streptomyces sp. NPDC001404 TaxID=3364571 RepID=UPI0036881835